MVQQAPVITVTEPAIEVCQHHWMIQPAEGPSSNGFCQVCGETRDFKNYVESATWGDTRLNEQLASRGPRRRTPDENEADMVSFDAFVYNDDED